MAFWALGGGKNSNAEDQLKKNTGLNFQLQDALLKDDKIENKLSFYKEADANSLKKNEILLNDPAYRDSIETQRKYLSSHYNGNYNPLPPSNNLNQSPYNSNADLNEKLIYNKINDLNQKIHQPDKVYSTNNIQKTKNDPDDSNEQFSNDIDKLHGMMKAMKGSEENDPEMQQLNNTLDKILDIQNPQRVKNRIKEKSEQNKEQVFIVSKYSSNQNVSLLDTIKNNSAETNNFYSLEKNIEQEEQNSISAVIHEAQTLMNGSIVKCRLKDDIYINGNLITKGNFVYGIAELNNDRLEISINSIRINQSIFPVKLEVYDMDGLPGIYIPGAISRDVTKQSAENGLQSMDFMTMNPSIKAQATATGINAAKSFFSKKAKQVKVFVKAGYKILLIDKNI